MSILLSDYNELLVMRLYCNIKQTVILILYIAAEMHMSPNFLAELNPEIIFIYLWLLQSDL